MKKSATAHRMFRALVLLLVLTGLPACYYYTPAEERPTNPEAHIRVQLPEPRDLATDDDVVVRSVVTLDGYPLQWTGDTLLMRTRVFRRTGDRSHSSRPGEVYRLGPREIEQIEVRKLDGKRSALWAGGIALVGGGLGVLLVGGDAGGNEAEKPDPENPGEMANPIVDFVLSIPVFGRP